VGTRTECDVPIWRAIDLKCERIGKYLLVAIGRGVTHQQGLAGFYLLAAKDVVFPGNALKSLHRWVADPLLA
jgi:hypothetical protein